MTCKCLKAIRGRLEAHHKSEVDLDLRATINLATGRAGMDLPPLNYKYKSGKGWKRSYVHFNYCPFCGKKP